MTAAPATVGYRVGLFAEIPPGEGRAFAVGSEQVAVFRLRSGALHAVSAVCPHAGGPLTDGQADARVVVCPHRPLTQRRRADRGLPGRGGRGRLGGRAPAGEPRGPTTSPGVVRGHRG